MLKEHESTTLIGIKFVMFNSELVYQKNTNGILKGEKYSCQKPTLDDVKYTEESDGGCKGA